MFYLLWNIILDRKILNLVSKLEELNENKLLINFGRFSGASIKSLLSLFMVCYPSTYNLTPNKEILGWCELEII